MSQLIKTLSMVLLVYCSIRAEDENKSYLIKSNFIDLAVHDGQESLLLSWSISDSIIVSQTKIFVKEFGKEEFELVAILPKGKLKYLDLECTSGRRYFYRIEVMDIFGKAYFSDFDTPPFGTCIEKDSHLSYVENISNVHDLVINHLNETLKSHYPYTDLSSILDLLNPKLKSDNKWIEIFPLEKLYEVEPAIPVIDDFINKHSLYEDILSLGKYYSNSLYLSPNEWEIEVRELFSKIRSDWELLSSQYLDAKDFYALIAPVRIISSKRTDESYVLEIYFFHPSQIYSQDVYVISNEEYVNLSGYVNLDSNMITYIEIPNDWEYVDLMMNDVFIQHCPLIIDSSVIYTIYGDIIPMGNNLEVGNIKVDRKKSSLWLNEFMWNPLSRKFNCELAGTYDVDNRYYIKHQNINFWEVQLMPSFDIQYVDSSFTLNEKIDIPSYVTLVQNTDSSVNILEYIYLDSLPFAISRMPDGESWHYSESPTMGETNKLINDNFDQALVPDLFVLYQNYPNPFNGQTKISFDLLEDAIINLYITDAKGRIHSKLVEEEYKSSGMYNYVWNGEGRSTGIYFITLVAQVNDLPPAIFSRKMIYLK
ncbi:MAG: hypothetical protein ACJZ12_03755 [Candidatus Neomarinimicrobiota bacterium]